MATETDIRLRSWLDANQRDREQMCRAILAIDHRYSDVRPRHPSGGPDGGRDIEAFYDESRLAFGAVGFANGANDSNEQKAKLRKKFTSDLASAFSANPEVKVFVFLTNVNVTMGEQGEMKQEARAVGITHCDILDRERLRIELDSPSGFFIRFQYLGIPLSEAEQASFLSRYGSQIQEVVTTGFQKVEKTLNRLLFLTESHDVLENLAFRFVLKKPYLASEIGHFRAFVFLTLRERRPDMFMLWFGSSDKSDRFRDDSPKRDMTPGIAAGIGGGQWERYIPTELPESAQSSEKSEDDSDDFDESAFDYKQTSWSSGVGSDPVPFVLAKYRHGYWRRNWPRLVLRDLDEGIFLPFVNADFADKIHSIQIIANGYKLDDFGPTDFKIDRSTTGGDDLPGDFTAEELADPWVRLRPSTFSSAYHFRFGQKTPRRLYEHTELSDSPPPQETLLKESRD